MCCSYLKCRAEHTDNGHESSDLTFADFFDYNCIQIICTVNTGKMHHGVNAISSQFNNNTMVYSDISANITIHMMGCNEY